MKSIDSALHWNCFFFELKILKYTTFSTPTHYSHCTLYTNISHCLHATTLFLILIHLSTSIQILTHIIIHTHLHKMLYSLKEFIISVCIYLHTSLPFSITKLTTFTICYFLTGFLLVNKIDNYE